MSEAADPVARWLERLERRHTSELTFPEIRRALQALSSVYVERREKLAGGSALEGAGKRAAFALYYGVQHLLLVRRILDAVGAPPARRILDLGCGTATAGAAWSLHSGGRAFVEGVDRSGWAVGEARLTLADLALRGRVTKADAARARLDGFDAVVAAYTINELADAARDEARDRLLAAAAAGTRVLVLEPLARRALTWWPQWEREITAIGGRADEWRFPADLPPFTAKLGRAAGLDVKMLTGRSLWLPGRP